MKVEKLAGILNIHPLLADRVRLAIVAALASAKQEVSFGDLVEGLQLSKGNLSTHMAKLEEANFIRVKKQFVDRKPRTTYEITDEGRRTFKEYLNHVQNLLEQSRT